MAVGFIGRGNKSCSGKTTYLPKVSDKIKLY